MQKRVHAGSVRMALCGDRGAGGASARSRRAPARSRATGEGAGSSVGLEPRGSSCSGGTTSPTQRPSFGGSRRCAPLGAGPCAWDGVTRTPRGRGRRPRAVARSQAGEDHTTTGPRWRARARTVLSRRGRLVSRFGQKKGTSTTWKQRTLRRSVGSRPTRVGNAQRARRRLAGLARRAGRGRATVST